MSVEQISGLPLLSINMKADALGKYGLSGAEVQAVVEASLVGKQVGEIYEGNRRFPLIICLPEELRGDMGSCPRHRASRRLPDHVGRHVRAAHLGVEPPEDRGSRRTDSDLLPAVHDVW